MTKTSAKSAEKPEAASKPKGKGSKPAAAAKVSENPRGIALDILMEILEKDMLSHQALRRGLKEHPDLDKQQRAFLTRLVEGTVERFLELDYVIGQYASVPIAKMKPVIRTIIRMGVYQILYMDSVPDSAVCNESVKLAVKRGFAGLKGFVNGLLRRISAEKEHIAYPSSDIPVGLSVRYSMPFWLVEKWIAAYGIGQTEQMLAAVLKERPLLVHRNHSAKSVEEILASLSSQGVQAVSHPYCEDALILSGVDRLDHLEAFVNGWIQPQDISSQLASSLAVQAMERCWQERQKTMEETGRQSNNETVIANEAPVLRILDVCAAPGGKSLYVADAASALAIPAAIISRDLTDNKTAMIEDNRRRIGLTNLHVETRNALVYDEAEAGTADVLIADLPCSGLGIMGRKNDIKYRMTAELQQELAKLQRQILSVVWHYVKPGGYVLYSTCTINSEENEENLRWLCENHPFQTVDITSWLPEQLAAETTKDGYLQLLPGVHDSDGFFMSALQRVK